MQEIKHKIQHQYQPTVTTCSPTALSMLLGHYDKELSVDEISEQVPQVYDEQGNPFGTINQQMATWCIALGFSTKMYTFDCQVIDQSWADLKTEDLLQRLDARKNGWTVPSLGKDWTEAYSQSYIDFLKASGELHIQPAVTTKLLYSLLKVGPVLPCLCFNTLYGKGRTSHFGEQKSANDDLNGRTWNHSVVIYGNDDKGNFLIADPFEKPGLHVIEPERMIAAISTAQIECDNLLFQLER